MICNHRIIISIKNLLVHGVQQHELTIPFHWDETKKTNIPGTIACFITISSFLAMPFWNLHEIRNLRKPNRFQPQAWHIWQPQNPATTIPEIPYIPCSSGIAIPSTSLCTAPSICSVKVLVLGGANIFTQKIPNLESQFDGEQPKKYKY